MKDMVGAMVIMYTLHGGYIPGVAYNANNSFLSAIISANGAQLLLGIVAAYITKTDGLPPFPEGFRQPVHILLGHGDNVIGQALR